MLQFVFKQHISKPCVPVLFGQIVVITFYCSSKRKLLSDKEI